MIQCEHMKQHSSHLKAGLMVGALMGIAAGFFLQSRQGKALTKQAQKKAGELQKQVMKKLGNVSELSQEKYKDVVDHVLSFYAKSKEISNKEMPAVKSFLMSHWKQIQSELKKAK